MKNHLILLSLLSILNSAQGTHRPSMNFTAQNIPQEALMHELSGIPSEVSTAQFKATVLNILSRNAICCKNIHQQEVLQVIQVINSLKITDPLFLYKIHAFIGDIARVNDGDPLLKKLSSICLLKVSDEQKETHDKNLKTLKQWLFTQILNNRHLTGDKRLLEQAHLQAQVNLLAHHTIDAMQEDVNAYSNPPQLEKTDPSTLPFIINGAGTYTLGHIAEGMLLVPTKDRLIETAALGTAFKVGLPVIKVVAVVSILSFVGYKIYRWFNNDTGTEAVRNEAKLLISRLEKDLRKADAQNFETMKKQLDIMRKRAAELERAQTQKLAAGLDDIKKERHATQALRDEFDKKLIPTIEQYQKMLIEWEDLTKSLDTLTPSARTEKLDAMRTKIKASKTTFEELSGIRKKRGFLAKFASCLGSEEEDIAPRVYPADSDSKS
jgi:hypothetical protein